jgi:hypothetical protein
MSTFESLDSEGANLAREACAGLELLAKSWDDEGEEHLAELWRRRSRHLAQVPSPPLDLALTVADGLDDLAERYEKIGRPDAAEGWRFIAGLVRERAWEREHGTEDNTTTEQ